MSNQGRVSRSNSSLKSNSAPIATGIEGKSVNLNYVNASPLHRIELQGNQNTNQYLKKIISSKNYNNQASTQPISNPTAITITENEYDLHPRDSIISVDSVQTSGRLLDRLGLDDDFENYMSEQENDNSDSISFNPDRRASIDSIYTTGRLLDRLGLDDDFSDNSSLNHDKNVGFNASDGNAPVVSNNNISPINTNLVQRAISNSSRTQPNQVTSKSLNAHVAMANVNRYQSTRDQRVPTSYQRIDKIAAVEVAKSMGTIVNQVKRPTVVTEPVIHRPIQTQIVEKKYPPIQIPNTDHRNISEQTNTYRFNHPSNLSPIQSATENNHYEARMISLDKSQKPQDQGGNISKHAHSLSNPSDMINFAESLNKNDQSITKSYYSGFYHATAPVLNQYQHNGIHSQSKGSDNSSRKTFSSNSSSQSILTQSSMWSDNQHSSLHSKQNTPEREENGTREHITINEQEKAQAQMEHLREQQENQEDDDDDDDDDFHFNAESNKHRSLLRTPSAPVMYNKRKASSEFQPINGGLSRRIISDKGDTRERSNSNSSATPLSVLTPEARVELAIKLRNSGKQREASYQLNIAANQGNKNAMLLYGLAVRYGYGVRKDDKNSFIWLCRAASIDYNSASSFRYSIDPFTLTDNDLPKIVPEPLAPSLFEIGMSYINGWGVIKNQVQGLQFIEKSASLGYVDAMCQAGTLWSSKGPHRKKDLFRSAAWFRLAELKGVKSIGNSWIYKDKYMKRR